MSWTDAENNAVVRALAVALELSGTDWSPLAVKAAVKALEMYPAPQVTGALSRCATECKFKLTLADIVSRLDDGRPGAEEAWALMPKDESDAGVVTQEMSAAWGVAGTLYDADPIAARMAFRETYERETREARQRAIPATWRLSPGSNRELTQSVACDAVKAGKLPPAAIEAYVLPEHRPVMRLALPPASEAQLEANKRRLAAVIARIEGKVPEPTLPAEPHWTETTERGG